MPRLAVVALLSLLLTACGLLPSSASPAEVAAESSRVARQACTAYSKLPMAHRTADADKACAAVLAVCAEGAPE